MDIARELGKRLLCGDYTQYTPAGKALFVRAGRWSNRPHLGDVVYFYSQGLGRVAHVGTVIEVDKQGDVYNIKTVEGNTSAGTGFNRNGGCVAIKSYSFNLDQVGGANRINGFGIPQFDENTCDVATFFETAKAEVGYEEKASNNSLEDKHANVGDRNYTKYGEWYGGNGLYWCQQFVSWVAYTACKAYQDKKTKNQWFKDGDDWYYKDSTGSTVKGRWEYINGRWYVFDRAGRAIKGWFEGSDEWYYLNIDYAMLNSQWLKLDGWEYYLTSSGAMAKSCYVRGTNNMYYWIDGEGHYDPTQDTREPDLQKYELAG